MKTFEQVKPALRNFIEKNRLSINEAGTTHDLENVLTELMFDDMIGPEETNIVAFYLIAYFAQKPLEWLNFTDTDLLQEQGTFEIYVYEPGKQKGNSWSGEFKDTDIKRLDQIFDGTWIKQIHYPLVIEKVLLDAKVA